MSHPHLNTTSSGNATPYITCQEVLDFVMSYLDQELDANAKHEFERHLKVCPSCVNYLDTYRKTVDLGKSCMCSHEEPSLSGVPEELVKAVLAARATLQTPGATPKA